MVPPAGIKSGWGKTHKQEQSHKWTKELCYLSLCVSCSSSRMSIHAFSCPNKGVLQRCLTSPAASQAFSSWLFWWSLNMQFSNHPTLIQQLCLGEQWTHVKFRMSLRHDCGHFAMYHGSCPQGASGRLAGTLFNWAPALKTCWLGRSGLGPERVHF